MCSYEGENKGTILLNVPAARMLSDEVDRADMIPFVEERSFFVEIEVWGGPGFEIENTEIKESVPQIKLMSAASLDMVTLHYLGRTSYNKAKGIAPDDQSTDMMHATRNQQL
jgi:hypothetical protein